MKMTVGEFTKLSQQFWLCNWGNGKN